MSSAEFYPALISDLIRNDRIANEYHIYAR